MKPLRHCSRQTSVFLELLSIFSPQKDLGRFRRLEKPSCTRSGDSSTPMRFFGGRISLAETCLRPGNRSFISKTDQFPQGRINFLRDGSFSSETGQVQELSEICLELTGPREKRAISERNARLAKKNGGLPKKMHRCAKPSQGLRQGILRCKSPTSSLSGSERP